MCRKTCCGIERDEAEEEAPFSFCRLVRTSDALTSSVLHDLVPIDLGASDGQVATEGLESSGTHGAVGVVERVLEISLYGVNSLECGLSERSSVSNGDGLGLLGVGHELHVSFFVVVHLNLDVALHRALSRSGLEAEGPGRSPASTPEVLLIEQVGGDASSDDDVAALLRRVGGLRAVHVVVGGVGLRCGLKRLAIHQ